MSWMSDGIEVCHYYRASFSFLFSDEYFAHGFTPTLSKNVSLQLKDNKSNKHNAEMQRTDPGTKMTGTFSTKAHIFPPNAQNGFVLFPSF